MSNPRKTALAAGPGAGDPWARWSTELPTSVLVRLKMRAAQERRPMRETLRAALEAYLATSLPGPRAGRTR